MKRRFDAALLAPLAFCSLGPAVVAAMGVNGTAPASHDEATIRVVGLGYTGILRAIDALLAAPFLLVPLGTTAARAGTAAAFVAGMAGAIAFLIARTFVPRVVGSVIEKLAGDGKPPSRALVTSVCLVGVLTATLGPAWQAEASVPGGSVTGALVVLVAVWAASMQSTCVVALFFGLAASYEPLVLLASMAGSLPLLLVRRRASGTDWLRCGIAFGLGLSPLGLGLAMRVRAIRLPGVPMVVSIEHPGLRSMLASIALTDIGAVLLVASALGLALSVWVPRMRRLAGSLAGMIAVGALATTLGAPRSGAALAAIVALSLLAAVTLAVAVSFVARAKVPFAGASAAMLVVLELVLPVQALDDTMGHRESHNPRGESIWTELAFGQLPVASVFLVADRLTTTRLTAARATGELRGDLVIVPAFEPDARALALEPKLASLFRDLALGALPEELSLAQLAAIRPVVTSFDPRWDRNLARHFVPIGLSSTFEEEPRGASERKKALDAFTPSKDRLIRVAVAKQDVDLAAATAALLRARAIGMAATGERDVLAKALDDLRPFAPNDAVASLLVRRTVTTKGPIDVHDLVP